MESNILNIFEEELKKELDIPVDWRYISTPWLISKDYDTFIELLDGEFTLISATKREVTKGTGRESHSRASLFISPKGVQNIKDFYAESISRL